MYRFLLSSLLATVFSLCCSTSSHAVPLQIVSSPQENSGPFLHNVFHQASGSGGASGSILAWFDLDATQLSVYDPATGALNAYFKIFSGSNLSTQIGTATAVGTGLLGSALSDMTEVNAILGSITWTLAVTSPSSTTFDNYMEGRDGDVGDTNSAFMQTAPNTWTITQRFADLRYVTSSLGYTANSWDPTGGSLTLWGADGTFIGSDKGPLNGPGGMGGFGGSAELGVDLVLKTGAVVTPEPGTLLLLGSGLAGLGIVRRRKRKEC